MRQLINKALIFIVIIGIIASIPLISERLKWEDTSNQVELILDYDDMYILANSTDEPERIEEQFFNAINNSITSIAIYESTLERLKLQGEYSGDMYVYSGKELLEPFRKNQLDLDLNINPNHTYILFANKEIENIWASAIKQFLAKEGDINSFNWNDYSGLEIAAPYRLLMKLSLGIDPILANKVKDYGFNLIPRLSNSYQDKERTLALIEQTAKYNPSNIIFQGEDVTGFPSHLNDVAKVMNQYQIGLGMVELVKEQRGIKTLAFHVAHIYEEDATDNNWYISRVHSLSERTMNRMINVTPAQLKAEEPVEFFDLQEQVELAATERNIRMFYIHGALPISRHVSLQNSDTITIKGNPEEIITKTVLGVQDISGRLLNEGFTLGQAEPFKYQEKVWMSYARWIALIGGIAIISLLGSVYLPSLNWLIFFLGIIGVALSKLINLESLYFKFIGLGTAVSFPVIAIYYSLQQLKVQNKKFSIIHMLKVYFLTSLVSFSGSLLVIGMFSHVKYSLYLDQFRGVSVLYLAPLILALILVMWSFNEPLIKWLKGNFKNYYILVLGILGAATLYYLARSGNEASISTLEIKFRKLLQSNLDVRPRTKEFLLAYPLFVLGIYFSYYYKRAAYLLIPAVMGQLSIVSTFTHLHTPFIISVIRTGIGLGLGLIIGFLLIIIWNILKPWLIKIIRRLNL